MLDEEWVRRELESLRAEVKTTKHWAIAAFLIAASFAFAQLAVFMVEVFSVAD